jgi:oxazoline/thiazoline dehydrogenase
VMERRRSAREAPASPITARELGELLFRSARVRRVYPAMRLDGNDAPSFAREEVTDRPYPSGGSCYELEIYPVVRRCDGIAPGLYHYCPNEHRLELVAGETAEVRDLLAMGRPWQAEELPEVLLVIAARFQRVGWRYESVAYSLMLKHTGVLYQTLYLAAAAMDLSPCAIGGGDSDLFARAAGLDYYVETSVGEFAIGGRARRRG